MRIPLANEHVTIYKRIETEENGKTKILYTRHALDGCSWRRSAIRFLNDTDAVRTEEITCRIPADQIAPEIGDFMFFGTVTIDNPDSRSLADAVKKYRNAGAMKVSSVSVNTGKGIPVPHYAARGG